MYKRLKRPLGSTKNGHPLWVIMLFLWLVSPSVFAAQSWNPTLLVSTEAFATVEVGDDASTTSIELRFGGTTMTEKLFYNRTNARFDFTRGIQVGGNITGTGTITAKSTLSGNLLHVSVGGAEIHGVLSSSGSYRSDADITLNDDAGATDAVLTFGNATANQTLKYLNTAQKFQFSKAVSVLGTLSGSSLNVDRNATVGGTLTSTGALRTKGNLSGNTLNIDSLTRSGALVYSSGSSLLATARGTSGNLLLSQGAKAPIWKAPGTSLVWFVDGALAISSTGSAVVTMPFALTVSTGSLRVNAAPTGAAILVDVWKDGATIYSTRPTIAAGTKTSAKTGTLSVTSLTEGSVINVKIDQVGSTLTGSGLTVMLNGTRTY